MLNLDSTTVPVVIALLGGVCVLAGLFGGMTGAVSLPPLNKRLRWSAGIFGVALLALGSAMWLFPQLRAPSAGDEATAPTGTTRQPASSSSAGGAHITYPPHGGAAGAPLVVTYTDSLIIEGTAEEFANPAYLWLFNLDPDDGRMYAVSDAPISVAKGVWSARDDGISDPLGTYKLKYVVLLRADARCNDELKAHAAAAKKNNTEPFGLSEPPIGCTEQDRVPVDVSPE
jgi:hypothetical protein